MECLWKRNFATSSIPSELAFSEILMIRDFVHALSLRCKDLFTWPFFISAGLPQSHALPNELVSLGIQNFTSNMNCTLFSYLHWNSVGETIAKHSFASVLKKDFLVQNSVPQTFKTWYLTSLKGWLKLTKIGREFCVLSSRNERNHWMKVFCIAPEFWCFKSIFYKIANLSARAADYIFNLSKTF